MENKAYIIATLCGGLLVGLVFLSYYAQYPDKYRSISLQNTGKWIDLFNSNRNLSNSNIMIAILLTKNMGYSEFTASVLRNHHGIDSNIIHVFTAPGKDYNGSNLRRWYGGEIKIKIVDENSPLKCVLETFVQSDYKAVFLIDSEIVFLTDWRGIITRHLIRDDKSFLSLYHSSYMHDYTKDCDKYIDELCEGSLRVKLGVSMSKRCALNILTKHSLLLEQRRWDEILRSEKITPLYPRKSLVMNIGQTNQSEEFCGVNEVPYGFNLCELPMWIRDGMEFYFDRCTNPQEKYVPDTSIKQVNKDKRLWTRPAVSFCLYGSKTRYTNGALANSKRVFSIYPGWKIWIFLDSSVPKNIVDELCEQNVKFVNVTGTHIKNKMSWRFLIASEPVKMYAIRDIDSRLLSRGKTAVDEWIKSGRKFHVMRDHPNHSRYPMSGGMWGGRRDAIPNMADLIKSYSGGNGYLVDMNFLNTVVWKIAKQSVWAHDSYSIHKFGEDHPFSTPWKRTEFVGNVDFH